MKKLIIATSGLLLSVSAFAQHPMRPPAQPMQPEQPMHQLKPGQPIKPPRPMSEVLLRKQPSNKAAVVAKIKKNQQLIPFYKKDGWVKVGDSKTGHTGWLSQKQLQSMTSVRNCAMHPPLFRQVFIESQQTDEQPQRLVVYRNGKQLSQKEARTVYNKVRQRLQKQQLMMLSQMQKAEQQMYQQFPMPVFQPIIIVNQQPVKASEKNQPKRAMTRKTMAEHPASANTKRQ